MFTVLSSSEYDNSQSRVIEVLSHSSSCRVLNLDLGIEIGLRGVVVVPCSRTLMSKDLLDKISLSMMSSDVRAYVLCIDISENEVPRRLASLADGIFTDQNIGQIVPSWFDKTEAVKITRENDSYLILATSLETAYQALSEVPRVSHAFAVCQESHSRLYEEMLHERAKNKIQIVSPSDKRLLDVKYLLVDVDYSDSQLFTLPSELIAAVENGMTLRWSVSSMLTMKDHIQHIAKYLNTLEHIDQVSEIHKLSNARVVAHNISATFESLHLSKE